MFKAVYEPHNFTMNIIIIINTLFEIGKKLWEMVGNFNDKNLHKQPFRGVLWKTCSENMQQIYRRAPMQKSNFTEIALRHGCSPVNLLYIFRTPFLKNTSE